MTVTETRQPRLPYSARASRRQGGDPYRLRALDGAERYGDRDFRRKFVRAMLTEELGEDLANQPEFERIANEVWSLIEDDEALRPQLEEALRELGNS